MRKIEFNESKNATGFFGKEKYCQQELVLSIDAEDGVGKVQMFSNETGVHAWHTVWETDRWGGNGGKTRLCIL